MARSWLLLAVGIAFDVAGATCLKLSHGLVQPLPSALMFACHALSLTTLAIAFRDMELSVAYTNWSVSGITLVASIGTYAFGEPMTAGRVFWLAVILAGVVGLRWSSADAGLR